MKRTYIWITLLLVIGVGIIGASAYKSFYYDEKQEVTQEINLFLKQQNYMTYVKNKEIRYDTSTGEFIARVVFQDEPKMNMRFIDRALIALKSRDSKMANKLRTNKKDGIFQSIDSKPNDHWK
ncbi:hypothetical protein OVA29_11670 [Exiguobacterium sp. SL14]|nr:DUF3139 domain-containing protein [Exiguobacterium sp. SL14]MCY1691260.1 hypothetical protein [Exiguobacterium sp. SL14]